MSFPSDPLHIFYASLAVITAWLALWVIVRAFTPAKKPVALKHVTMVREEEPVTTDLFHSCLGCGRRPQPELFPFCSCGRGLARIEQAVPTPDDEPPELPEAS